jgi:hypothetical protein
MKVPTATPIKLLEVARLMMLRILFPAMLSRPSVIIFIPYMNKAKPPRARNKYWITMAVVISFTPSKIL